LYLSNSDYFILLSFGGYSVKNYHTMLMKYKSVWENENENESSSNKQTNTNEWIPLPNQIIFGRRYNHDLGGAGASIGGENQNLLFIAHYPENIDIIDLESFQYLENIQNNILPFKFFYHCFVSLNKNQFISISGDQSTLIEYNETNKEFSYHTLPSCSYLKGCNQYSYVFWNDYIIILGGNNSSKFMDEIKLYNVKEKKWQECDIKIPVAISGSVAVVNECDLSIHLIGGLNKEGGVLDTHYVLKIKELIGYTLKEVVTISEYWRRNSEVTRYGWIQDFHFIIAQYLCGKLNYKLKEKEK